MASTVLVAEDEKNIIVLISLYLTREGFLVESASDGEEALEKAHRLRPDLVMVPVHGVGATW